MKSPCWHQVLNLQTSGLDLSRFAAIPSEQDLAILITVTAPLDCSLDFFAFIEKIQQTHSRVSTSFRGGPLLSLRRCNSSLSNNNILKCLRSQTTFSIGCQPSIFFQKYGLFTFFGQILSILVLVDRNSKQNSMIKKLRDYFRVDDAYRIVGDGFIESAFSA